MDVRSSNIQTANIMHPHSHTHTYMHTNTHLDTHKHLRAGRLKKKFSKKRRVFREDLKELTEDA